MSSKHAKFTREQAPLVGSSLRAWLCCCSAFVILGVSPQAQGQLSQSLSYNFSASTFDSSLNVDHGLRGIELGVLDFSLSQSTSYSLDTGLLGDYQVGVDVNDEENFFGNFSGTLGSDLRSIGGFADNRFARDNFSVGVSASGSLEYTKSTVFDEGLLDPDFDFFDFTDEELEAIVWVPSHFAEGAATLEVNRFSIGRLKVRLKADGTIGHSDFGGLTYSLAAATGFSIGSKDGDDEFDFFFEESNLSANVPGGGYGAGDGELVLAAGYDSDGVAKLAAIIFKGWSPTDKFDLSFDAEGGVQYLSEEGVAFDEGSVRLGAGFRPAENWNIDTSLTVGASEELIPSYSFHASLDYSKFLSFSPFVRFSAFYSEGQGDYSLPVGVNATVYDKLLLSAEVTPSYATFDESFEVRASGNVTLLGPPLLKDGASSEFSLSASAALYSQERSVSVNGRFSF